MAKILIVDDAKFMRTALRNLLENMGHQIVGEAINGIEAVEKYKELRPEVVTLDITMPQMDGIDALKEIKKYDNNAKIIMCSAMGQQAMVVEAIKEGAMDFIVKPFKATRVKESFSKVL